MAAQRQCQEANLFPSYSTWKIALIIKKRYLTCKYYIQNMYYGVDIELGQSKHAAMLWGASDRSLDPGHTEAPDPTF